MTTLSWGSDVSPEFRARVDQICAELGIEPSALMACMAFESGRTFSPSVRNAAGSGAVGLIQFMPTTAAALHTSTDKLAAMTAVEQLSYVQAYFEPWRGRLHNLGDVYFAILFPLGIGKADSFILFSRGETRSERYRQNASLDQNKDGEITRGEVMARVRAVYDEGMKPPHVWTDDVVAA